MVLGNTRLYGGKVRLTAEAVIDDGQLDGIAFFPTNVGETLRLAGKVALGKLDDPRLSTFRAESVSIETPGLPVQLDGDHIGETPMQFTVERAGLLVSVPAGPLKPIFGGPHSNRRPNP